MHDLKPAVKIITGPRVNSVKRRMLLRLEENFSFSLSGAETMALLRSKEGPTELFVPNTAPSSASSSYGPRGTQ